MKCVCNKCGKLLISKEVNKGLLNSKKNKMESFLNYVKMFSVVVMKSTMVVVVYNLVKLNKKDFRILLPNGYLKIQMQIKIKTKHLV